MSTSVRVIMTREEIALGLQRIALQILEKNHDAGQMAVVGIYTCGVYLAHHIVRLISELRHTEVDFGSLDISLYRDDWSSIAQSPVVKTTDIVFPVENRNIILIDDVIFTGRTIRAAMDALMDYGRPRSIQLATLVDRGGRELPIQPDYTGMVTSIRPNERIKVLLDGDDDIDRVVIES